MITFEDEEAGKETPDQGHYEHGLGFRGPGECLAPS
jgi:hypothetical protein